jgi:MFS family permease
VAGYGAGAFAASLVGGWMADRAGRRATMLLSFTGGAAGMLAVPFVRAPLALGLALGVLGFLVELYRPAVSAAVADLVPPEDRPRAYALLYWVINVGAAIGPVVAGLLARRSFVGLFVVDALTMLAFAGLVWRGLPETRPAADPEAAGAPPVRFVALRDPLLLGVVGLRLLWAALLFQIFVTLPIAMRDAGLSEATFGRVLALNGLLVVATSLPVARWVARRPPLRVLAASSVLMGLGWGLTGLAATAWGFAGALVVWTAGEIMSAPVTPSLVAGLAPPERRGAYLGAYNATWGLAAMLGPGLGGLVYGRFGPAVLWTACAVVGLVAAAGFLALQPLLRRRTAAA